MKQKKGTRDSFVVEKKNEVFSAAKISSLKFRGRSFSSWPGPASSLLSPQCGLMLSEVMWCSRQHHSFQHMDMGGIIQKRTQAEKSRGTHVLWTKTLQNSHLIWDNACGLHSAFTPASPSKKAYHSNLFQQSGFSVMPSNNLSATSHSSFHTPVLDCAQHTGHAAFLKEHISTSPIRIISIFTVVFLHNNHAPMSQLPVPFVMSPPEHTFAQGCRLHLHANPLPPCFQFGVQLKAQLVSTGWLNQPVKSLPRRILLAHTTPGYAHECSLTDTYNDQGRNYFCNTSVPLNLHRCI